MSYFKFTYRRAGYSPRGFGTNSISSKSDSVGLANTLDYYDYYGEDSSLQDKHEDNFLVKLLKYFRGDSISRNDECYGDYCDYYYDDGYRKK